MRDRGIRSPILFGVIVASFLAAIFVIQWQIRSVGQTSLEIADSNAPSIEYLANARGEMRHLEVLLRDWADAAKAGEKTRPGGIDLTRNAMNESIADYLQLPVGADEQRLWGDILRTKDVFNGQVDGCVADIQAGDERAVDASLSRTMAAGDALGIAVTRAIELNAEQSHELALQIAREQKRSTFLAFALAALCACIALGGGIGLRRIGKQREALAEERRRLQEARASELEQFAGRVAHDILSPLGTVGLALSTAANPSIDDAMRSQIAQRGGAAIQRIGHLVNGLLAFAVAGAAPDPEARADVEATVADLERDLREEAAAAGAELHTDVRVGHLVACNVGVLTSIVSNLARNAIKYIGDGPVRRIDVRAFETKNAVRLEVQDTGPGLLPELEPRVFEPYVRGQGTRKSGIGLGLATVKRVVVAHRGRVGVKSVVGEGCTFWVELPKAEEVAPRATDQAAATVH